MSAAAPTRAERQKSLWKPGGQLLVKDVEIQQVARLDSSGDV
jgi:hypothetical protein